MRCKLHPYANAAGVCAPCLRDRLLVLAAERDQADCSSGGESSAQTVAAGRRSGDRSRGGDGGLQRPVSPYDAVRHRRSDACAYTASRHSHSHQPELLFFRTPQVGPAAARAEGERGEIRRKAARRRSSFLVALFGGRRRHGREEEEESKKDPPRRSTSWLSSIVRRKRRPDTTSSLPPPLDERAESPGRSTTTSSWWFPSSSPVRHHHRRSKPGGASGSSAGDGISGFAVCLSPLVRPSSVGGRRRCQPPEPSSMGESHRRHLSAGGVASFGRNTSRKLADMGRRFR